MTTINEDQRADFRQTLTAVLAVVADLARGTVDDNAAGEAIGCLITPFCHDPVSLTIHDIVVPAGAIVHQLVKQFALYAPDIDVADELRQMALRQAGED